MDDTPPRRPKAEGPRLESAELRSAERPGRDCRLFRFFSPEIARAARPGQFVHLRVPALEKSALRRPFSLCDADPATGEIALLCKEVGRGTAALSSLSPGDRVDLMGPLGRGFPPPPPGADVLLVGGGYGVAPLHFLARTLLGPSGHPTILLFAGGRTADDLLLLDAFRAMGVAVHPATDDGSLGAKGLVTAPLDAFLKGLEGLESLEGLEKRPSDLRTFGSSDLRTRGRPAPPVVLYACGPAPMLRALDARALAGGFPAWLSLDRRMACGVGACCGCAQKTRGPDGAVRVSMVCSDGPVFPAGSIVWE